MQWNCVCMLSSDTENQGVRGRNPEDFVRHDKYLPKSNENGTKNIEITIKSIEV